MRKIIFLLLLLSMTLMLAAIEPRITSTETLRILGYKVSPDAVNELTITDAFSESLDTVGEGGAISMDEHIGALFGDVNERPSDFTDQTAFSYRVASNTTGSYELLFTIEPLERVGGSEVIRASYQLGNLSYSFPEASDDSIKIGEADATIGPNESVTNPDFTGAITSSPGTLKSSWIVDDLAVGHQWIHRGAIAVTIDKSSAESDNLYAFDNAPNGRYRALVTVNLSVN